MFSFVRLPMPMSNLESLLVLRPEAVPEFGLEDFAEDLLLQQMDMENDPQGQIRLSHRFEQIFGQQKSLVPVENPACGHCCLQLIESISNVV